MKQAYHLISYFCIDKKITTVEVYKLEESEEEVTALSRAAKNSESRRE